MLQFLLEVPGVTREVLPLLLNQQGLLSVLVELGTFRGDYAGYLRQHWKGEQLYAVDRFVTQNGRPMPEIQVETQRRAASENWTVIVSESSVAAAGFADESVDCVYVDASHDYTSVRRDLLAWWPKLKPDGIMAGHDFINGKQHRPGQRIRQRWRFTPAELPGMTYGVRAAVLEFATEVDRGVLVLPELFPSWLISRQQLTGPDFSSMVEAANRSLIQV